MTNTLLKSLTTDTLQIIHKWHTDCLNHSPLTLFKSLTTDTVHSRDTDTVQMTHWWQTQCYNCSALADPHVVDVTHHRSRPSCWQSQQCTHTGCPVRTPCCRHIPPRSHTRSPPANLHRVACTHRDLGHLVCTVFLALTLAPHRSSCIARIAYMHMTVLCLRDRWSLGESK